jgi:hypothetical protein
MALEATQPVTKMSTITITITRDPVWDLKAASAYGWPLDHFQVPIVWKFWESQPAGPLSACPGL